MKYSLFTYEFSNNGLINIGDYVQSLAAKQFLPQVDQLLERDALNSYDGDETKIIMNGWYTHKPENWPPSDKIIPLFVSFHLNKSVSEKMMANTKIVEYFKKHAPIGCRDHATYRRLKHEGVDSYYSGCLTTTLNHNDRLFETKPQKNNNILLVDVLFKDNIRQRIGRNRLYFFQELLKGNIFKINKVDNYIKSLIPDENKSEIKEMTCYFTENSTEKQRFEKALDMLKAFSEAKVVVTSRIHVALPCLALGTPVLFVFGGKLTNKEEFKRLDGIINLMNVLVDDDFDTSADHLKEINFFRKTDIDWSNPPQNPDKHLKIREELIQKCKDFVS